LSCEYLREFSTKFETVLNWILWGWGETDSSKKEKQKTLVTLYLTDSFLHGKNIYKRKNTMLFVPRRLARKGEPYLLHRGTKD
jgi:hypothetical protein